MIRYFFTCMISVGWKYCILLFIGGLKNFNCEFLRKAIRLLRHKFSCRNNGSLCRDKECTSLFEVIGKFVATYLFMSQHYVK